MRQHPWYRFLASRETDNGRLTLCCPLSVLPMVDEVVDDSGLRQRRGVAEIIEFVLGDLAQNAAHDLAGSGLRQTGRELNQVRRGNRSDLLAHPSNQLSAQLLGGLFFGHQGHVRINALPLYVVRITHHGGLGYLRMGNEGGLDFGGPKPMAGHIDDIVDPTGNPIIAIGIAPTAVAGEIFARICREVGLHEALVVAVDRAHLSRPGIRDAQISLGDPLLHPALRVDDLRLNTEEWPRCRAGLEPGGTGQRRNQDAAGFGLPPLIDDGAAPIPDDAVIPLPGLRIDRLPDAPKQPQARARSLLYRRVAALHERPDCGRRRVEDVDLVFVDNLPESRIAG